MLISLISLNGFGQASPFVRVQVSRSALYIQEPFRVTITVLTPTWFTAPPDFSNLSIPNCFILPFDQTVPGMFDVGKKQYAGIQFYYIVFPYKSGKFTVPPFQIDVMSPTEGTAVSRKWTLRSREIPFLVKDIPNERQLDYWMVAKNVFLRETWNKSLAHLKVGDVLERTDFVNARGTLPQFIPAIPVPEPDWASAYPKDAVLKDERNDADANGSRQQRILYLLEKEGEFTFPAFTVSWWNPQAQRMFSRTVKPVQVTVAANPNLGMLKTLRDSLAAKPLQPEMQKPTPKTIGGLTWYQLLFVLAGISLCIYLLFLAGKKLYGMIRSQIRQYHSSEKYWFRKFKHSDPNTASVIRNFYKWWDRKKNPSSPNIIDSTQSGLLKEWEKTEARFYGTQTGPDNVEMLKNKSAQFRQLTKKTELTTGSLNQVQAEWPA